jgi:TRAP-type C4-dicarboxylate transport system substrate-binding protein
MKKSLWGVLITCCFVAFSMLTVSVVNAKETTSKKPINLSFAMFLPPFHQWSKLDDEFCTKIEEDSGGKVKIRRYFGATLSSPLKWHEECVAGVADISHGNPFFEISDFPIASRIGYFGIGQTDRKIGQKIGKEVWDMFPERRAEYSDVKLLTQITVGMAWYHTAKKPIRTLDDLKGLSMRVLGEELILLMKELDVSPVKMPAGELYDALQKGIVDGYLLPMETLISLRGAEVTRYHTRSHYFNPMSEHIIMNLDKWNSLSSDIQQVFLNASAWYEQEAYKRFEAEDAKAVAHAKKQGGHEFYDLSPQDLTKFYPIQIKLALTKAKELDAMGLPGTKIFEAYQTLSKKYGNQ